MGYNNNCYITNVIIGDDSVPPVSKISKDMILKASLEILKKSGIENLNVRNIANKLNCSTQPIMYHYKNMDILKEELYVMVDKYHSEFLMRKNDINPLLSIGIQYIRFAEEEKNLFKFLFQSDKFSNFSFENLFNNENELKNIFNVIKKETDLSDEKIKGMITILFITVHGIASLLANNSMIYDEEEFMKILVNIFGGLYEK